MNDNNDQQMSAIEADAQRAAFQAEGQEQARLAETIANIASGRPVFVPNVTVVDSVALAKAYGRFVNAQTRFLLQTYQYGTQEFLEELGSYSRAQTELTNALQLALHQANVI